MQVSDLTNPKTGKTYKEENLEKKHNIELGTLVEVDFDDPDKKGLRLFVVRHDRDCDGTPLYSLSFNKNWKEIEDSIIPKIAFRMELDSGYSESCLKIIK